MALKVPPVGLCIVGLEWIWRGFYLGLVWHLILSIRQEDMVYWKMICLGKHYVILNIMCCGIGNCDGNFENDNKGGNGFGFCDSDLACGR